jgi:hypothetical protein
MNTATLTRPAATRFSDAQIADARRADILTLVPGLHKWARTDGGEYAGPCPLCGGVDRFHAWPYRDRPGARCRQCHDRTMDPIDLVIWLGKAPDFARAVAWLTGESRPRLVLVAPDPQPTEPRPYYPPRNQQVVARYNYWHLEPADDNGSRWRLAWQKERREPYEKGNRKLPKFVARYPRPGIPEPRDDCPTDWHIGRPPGLQLQPYNARAAMEAPLDTPLIWCDGERDVDNLAKIGLVAVCAPDGGARWQAGWGALFFDHDALVIPDDEPGGQDAAERAARLIAPYTHTVRIIKMPIGKDFSDWAEARRAEGVTHVA